MEFLEDQRLGFPLSFGASSFSSGMTPATYAGETGSRSNSIDKKLGSLCSGRRRVRGDVCVAYKDNKPVNIKKEKNRVR